MRPEVEITNQGSKPLDAIASVLVDPTRTFISLADRPRILPVYLVHMAVSILGVALLTPLTLAQAANYLADAGAPHQAPMEAKWIAIVSGLLGAMAGPWLSGLLVSLIAALFGEFLGGGIGIRSYLTMVGYARLPLLLGSVLQTLLVLWSGSLREAEVFSLSLAVFVGDEVSPALRALLGTLNPFGIWYFVLLGVGLSAFHGVQPGKGKWFALTMYGLAVVGNVLAATLRSLVEL